MRPRFTPEMFREFILRIRASVTSDMERGRGKYTHTRTHTHRKRKMEKRETSRGEEKEEETLFKYKFPAPPFFIADASLFYERQEKQAGYRFALFISGRETSPVGEN